MSKKDKPGKVTNPDHVHKQCEDNLKRDNNDTVYIVKNPSFNYYKIGHTKNLRERLKQLNTSVPHDYELICTFEHELKETLEKELHSCFKEKRYNREFFDLEYADFLDVFRIADQEGYKCTYENVVNELTRMLVEKKIVRGFVELMGSFAEDQDVKRLIKMAYSESTQKKGVVCSERDRINILLDEIKDISDEYGGSAPKNVLYGNMVDKYSISENNVDEMIDMLNGKGVIYAPTEGHYKMA